MLRAAFGSRGVIFPVFVLFGFPAVVADKFLSEMKKELSDIKCGDRAIDAQKLWKIKKKFCPQSRDPPTAMLDIKGNLLTTDSAIQNRAIEVY